MLHARHYGLGDAASVGEGLGDGEGGGLGEGEGEGGGLGEGDGAGTNQSVTGVPVFTVVDGGGSCAATTPFVGQMELLTGGWPITTVSPAALSALIASRRVSHTTFGTLTCAGPLDTMRLIVSPGAAAFGS